MAAELFVKRTSCILVLALMFGAADARSTPQQQRVLRVCADPNNLPFSNDKREGFENKLAELLAAELHARVEYTWRAQRRGFIRETLKAKRCDVVLGVPVDDEMTLHTKPIYSSSYVFVTRADRPLHVSSFDDAALKSARIGVHLIGDDAANTPPAHALAKRGIINNVVGFTIYGDYMQHDPPVRLLEALDRGDIDVAIVWGPLAGFYARHSAHALTIVPVQPERDGPLTFRFVIAAGVRKDDVALRDELNAALTKRSTEVRALLKEYAVPTLASAAEHRATSR
jgi:mxaJ protein